MYDDRCMHGRSVKCHIIFGGVASEHQSYVFSTHDFKIRWKRNMRRQELNSGKRMKIERSGRTRYERETGPDCGCNRLECFSKIDRETRGTNTTYKGSKQQSFKPPVGL